VDFFDFQILLANLVVGVATFVQASAGLGFAMLAIPLLAVIDLAYIPGPTLFVSLFLTLVMFVKGRSAIVYKEIVTMSPALVIGTVLGALTIDLIPQDVLGITFGVLILTGVAITVFARPIGLTRASLLGGGFASGLMGTISGIHGPPLVLLYQNEAIEKTRATIALIFCVAYILSLAGLTAVGQFGTDGLLRGLSMLPGLLIGLVLALRARHLFSTRFLRIAMLSIASASAVVLLSKSVVAW